MTDHPIRNAWKWPVFALSLAAFAVGTTELIIAGLLPSLAADLAVDIPTAGLLISGYALGVAVGGPIFALVTGSLPRRPLLLCLMAVFVLGNGLCALAGSYWLLLGARLKDRASYAWVLGGCALCLPALYLFGSEFLRNR
jgi:predicted MFS family arabinose efflux permease